MRDNIKLFKNTGEAFVGDKEITLTKKEFEVLYILASHPNTIYSKAELFESVWGYDSLGDTSALFESRALTIVDSFSFCEILSIKISFILNYRQNRYMLQVWK